MAQNLSVRLNKAEAPSLGFRLQGGKDFGTPLVIQKVNIGSPAEKAGLLAGDSVIRVNNTDVFNLRHKDAQDVIIRAGPAFEITVQRGGSTWRPTVTPTASIPAPQPTINNVAPVTKTSLAAKPQPSIGAIGTGHNLSAKPFNSQVNGTVNGGPKLVNKQYNTPVGLYSEQSIAETLSAQAEVLSTGVLGVNFKKNEKNYDASNSAVFRMVQEADKAPRDAEPVVRQNFYTTHSHAVGGRTATPLIERSSSRQEAVLNQSEYAQRSSSGDQDMTKCTDCERVIVGVFVRIKDKNLHVECFKCSTCGASLKNVGYYNINNKLYCDVHAKLAARSNPPSENYLPVTVPPGKVAPAGAISAALASRPLPTVGPASPLSPSANVTAQPFQQSENANQVPMTELDGVDRQNEEDILNLVNSVTLAASKKKNTPGEKKFISETFIPINNNHKSDPLKISGPIPYNQYIAKTGTNFTGARPYSSVNSPLSPPINNYSTLPKAAPVSAPFSAPISAPAPGRSIQNIVWPPPPDEPDLPTATPLYFPPPSHVQIPSPPIRPPPPNVIPPAPKDTTPVWRKPTPIKTETREASSTSQETSAFSKTQASSKSVAEEDFSSQTHLRDYSESEELCNIVQNMDPKMSLCSSEVTSIVDRRSAVEHIETVAETQMFVESVMQQRPRSPPPIDQDIKPKVEVQTEPRDKASKSPYEPRVVTRVCVCTNSCCNASEGKLCESCPLRGEPAQLKRPTDYQKSKPLIENAVPRRYGSPLITGVSVTINNPGKIKESSNAFAQIPTKKTTTALGSALAVAPAEPFTPVSGVFTTMEPVPLPEETQPYFPPERPVTVAKPKPPKEEVEKPDTPFVSALKVAPERAFTPVGGPAPVRKKKPKEDPLLKDLPKPHQWMSMVTALTTASDRSYSPFISETVSKQSSRKEEIEIQETTVKTSQKELLRRSAQNETARPYTKPVIREKYEAVNDEREVMQIHFPPISDELKASFDYKADYSEIKSEISSQIIEQAHLEQESSIETFQESCQKSGHCDKESVACESQKLCCKSQKQQDVKQANVIAKQREETVLKKPLELAGNLHKPEYLPQYQMSLNYDETIQLPHHKDIRKLLPSDQSKQDTRRSMASKSVLSSQMDIQQTYVPPPLPVTQFKQVAPPTKPVTTIQPGQENLRATQMSFQPVAEERPPRTTFSPRPGSLTPSMINKPAPTLPYYQANLVATEHLAPEVNLFDPKSPAVSRSPSPCPEGRSSSPFPRQAPRPVSPAPGPPPNPLKAGQVPTFTKEDRMLEEAKKNITAFIPQYREKVESMQDVQADLSLAENMQTLEVRVPSQQTLAVQGKAGFVQSAQEQCYQKEQMQESAYKSQLMATATKQGSSVTSISESAKMQQMQQQNRMQSESVERSADNSVQIQRRRTVNEEYEHSQKSKVIEVKTSSTTTGQYPFQKVNNPQIEQQGILGLHVTNPQPIVSPFLSKGKDQVQQIQPKEEPQPPKPIQQPVPPPRSSSQGFNPTAPNLPNPVRSVAPPSVSTKATSSPGASANKPTVSQPNTGSGGGRQAGAIGVAPKRGRGVLNVGGLIGSRIPLCGHCHGSIRVFMFCCLTELGHGAERANATVERNDNAKAAEIIPTNPTTFNQINVTQNTPQYSPIFARRNSPLLAQPNRANTSELHQNVLSEIKNRVPKYDPPEKKVDVTDTQNGATKYAPPIAKNIDPSPFHKTDSKIVVSNVELKPSIDTLKHVSQQPIKYDGKNFVSGKVDIKLPNSETSLPLNELVTRADANNHAANFISQKIAMSVGLKPATQVSKETDTKVYKTIGTLNPGLINNVVPKLNHKNNTDISHNIPISNDTNLTTAPTYTDIPFSNNKYADHDFSDFTINTPTKIATENAPNNGMDSAIIENNKTNDLKSDTNPSHNKADEQAAVPICNVCNNEIKRGPFITALGKIWCPDHFICATPTCRRPLQDLGFVEEQGQLYCEYCFEQYLAPPCAKCNVKIKGDCLKAIGKKFHPECFNCSYCGKLFGNSPFFLEDGQPYCENDWNELFTTKCFACGFPVEAGDRWVEALNNNYHSQCFNCTMCKKNLEGQSFFAKGGRPFCKNHAR